MLHNCLCLFNRLVWSGLQPSLPAFLGPRLLEKEAWWRRKDMGIVAKKKFLFKS